MLTGFSYWKIHIVVLDNPYGHSVLFFGIIYPLLAGLYVKDICIYLAAGLVSTIYSKAKRHELVQVGLDCGI